MNTSRTLAATKLFEMGSVCAAAGKSQEALEIFRGVLALKPDDARFLLKLGLAFEQLQRPHEAVSSYRLALEIDPNDHLVLNNVGNALASIGRFEEATSAYQIAIRLSPTTGAYYRNLVEWARIRIDAPHFKAMEVLMANETLLPLDDRIQFHFALGKVLTESGQPDKGFQHLCKGNALQRSRTTYDENKTFEDFALTRRAMTADLLRGKSERTDRLSDNSSAPIFVIGMPRSGSTLVEQVLASHPRVIAGGELKDFPLAVTQVLATSGLPSSGTSRTSTAVSAVHHIEDLTRAQLQAIGVRYLHRIRSMLGNPPSNVRLVDKMPFNFAFLGLIHLALPNAKFIHTRRAPVETCLSCFGRLFQNVPFSYDLGELGRYYREYDTLMTHWRATLPPGVLLEVNYEDIVNDFGTQAREIIRHVGLEWDDACLSFHKTARTITTASAAQVRQPIYTTSVTHWRPADDLLRPLLDGLGPGLNTAYPRALDC